MSMEWIYSTNIYEVNVRQYTPEGTLNAFKQQLPRLKDMGVETLWFMPLTPIAQKNKKGSLGSYYACRDFLGIDTEFGTWGDWLQLVADAKDLGFKVIIDWVANHTGWDHVWTIDHPEWFEKDETTGEFKMASGMEDIIELDFSNEEMRAAMINAMKVWVESGIDGFRCDLAFWVQLDFWQQAKLELEKIKPLFWFGELDVLDSPEYMTVFDACYTWRWMHKAEHFNKVSASFSDLKQVLEQYLNTSGIKSWFTANHDENSWNGTEYEKYGRLALLLAVFSCTWPGVPLVYSGQELPNHKRLRFFDKDPIEWQQLQLHEFYKQLFAIRKLNAALSAHADVQIRKFEDGQLVFERRDGDSQLLVALNFSSAPSTIGELQNYQLVFSDGETFSDDNLQLAPHGYAIFQKETPAG